jgi:hypothetical protein
MCCMLSEARMRLFSADEEGLPGEKCILTIICTSLLISDLVLLTL